MIAVNTALKKEIPAEVSHIEEHSAFSHWTHFAWALAPMALGQIYLQVKDYMGLGSGWLHFSVTLLFIIGVGASVGILWAIGQAADYESRQ